MTPGINAAKKAKIAHTIHKYTHDPKSESYGIEAALKLNVPEEVVFKTLVVSLDTGVLAVGIIPVAAMLNMKRMAKACGAKKAAMGLPVGCGAFHRVCSGRSKSPGTKKATYNHHQCLGPGI